VPEIQVRDGDAIPNAGPLDVRHSLNGLAIVVAVPFVFKCDKSIFWRTVAYIGQYVAEDFVWNAQNERRGLFIVWKRLR